VTKICALVLALGLLAPGVPQKPDTPRFRVGVDAVRIDAVVTDRLGRIVGDLEASDFDVRQDGKPEKVTFVQFVPVDAGSAKIRQSQPPNPIRDPSVPATVPRAPTRESIQRTFAIVVDDLGLSFESFQNTQRALHVFLDRELGPADLAAIVRTGGSGGALQSFTTDRRVLHAAVDALRWNGASRNGVEAFEPVNKLARPLSDIGRGGSPGTELDPNDFTTVNQLRQSMSAAGTLGALNLVVRAARDLPGRKALIFVSEGFRLLDPKDKQPVSRVRIALDRVVDQATRAGVVIYSLDSRGLQTGGLQTSDNTGYLEGPGIREEAGNRTSFLRDTQEGMAYLAEQTGGFAVLNNNDLARGLGRITDDVRGYYVIGYVPQDNTFAGKGQTPRLHKISIAVRRPGLRVKTRKEFLGVSDPPDEAGEPTPARQLVRAAVSPFAETGVTLRATTLPGYSVAEGAFIRTLLHIDARGLTFADADGGKKTAAADVLGMVFDQDGVEVARLNTGFSVALADKAADEALRDGLAYTLRIRVPRPGGYQVRFAVRDQHSGLLGSAGGFVDVADMAGGAFALSGIVLKTDDGSSSSGAGIERLALSPEQAIRLYPANARLSYAYEIYNASAPVQSTVSIWRGSERVFAAAPDTLVVPSGSVLFAARGGLRLAGLPSGSYTLQISATTRDPRRPTRNRVAVQRIDFDVRQ
jgi:VWFA-related protein